MTTKNPKQDEIMNTFVASIPTMQTDIALLKQDMALVKKNGETVLSKLDKMSVVSKSEFEQYKKEEIEWKEKFSEDLDTRFLKIEKYNQDNQPGVSFANALVSRWTTFLVLLLLTAAVIALIGKFVTIGG